MVEKQEDVTAFFETELGTSKSNKKADSSVQKSISSMTLSELESLVSKMVDEELELSKVADLTSEQVRVIASLPKKPQEPGEYDCCGSGCEPCVWDIYERDCELQQKKIKKACKEFKKSQ